MLLFIPEFVYSKLMVVGGYGAEYDVEVIDLGDENQNCRKPANYPIEHASTGFFFDGQATVCGGGYPVTDSCYSFDFQVKQKTNYSFLRS